MFLLCTVIHYTSTVVLNVFFGAYIVIVIYAIIPGRTGSNSEESKTNLTQFVREHVAEDLNVQ